VMVTLADAATTALGSDPARAGETMHEVSSTGRQALTDMRRMLGVLRDQTTAGAGQAGAGTPPSLTPQPGLGDLDALVERVRGTGLRVSVARAGQPFALSDAAGLTVYRIVQEALTNALKHAGEAPAVEVRLEFDDPDVAVRVTDDGRTPELVPRAAGVTNGYGQVAGRGASAGGHGVAGMTERAATFGGTLRAGPRAAGGWEVVATLRDCKAPTPT